MNFLRLKPTHPLYQQGIGETDISGFEVYTERQDSIGKVTDILLDETQRAYYVVVETGSWLSRKSVLLPLSRFQVMPKERRLYLMGVNKAEVEKLPAYTARTISADRVPQTAAEIKYQPVSPLEASPPIEASLPLETDLTLLQPVVREDVSRVSVAPSVAAVASEPKGVGPASSDLTEAQVVQPVAQPVAQPAAPAIAAEETVRLLEERLVVNRQKRKVGEVIVRKEIETRMVEVPVRRERLIIEQVSPEHKQLAAINLHEDIANSDMVDSDLLDSLELREPALVADEPRTSQTTQSIPINLANQVLYKLTQFPQFSNAQVTLVFSDPELQTQYQRWLTERKTS